MANSSAWFFLLAAGILEIAWAVGLKSTHGFTKLWPSVYVLAMMGISFYFLSQAVKELPMGTAYAVWTGIGAAGTALIGILFFHEPAHFYRITCIFLIVAGTLGLKFLP